MKIFLWAMCAGMSLTVLLLDMHPRYIEIPMCFILLLSGIGIGLFFGDDHD